MKNICSLIQVVLGLVIHAAHGQGTFVYDQQSATESTGGGAAIAIQSNQPIGQSFTPTLSLVGFIRLKLFDDTLNAVGATVRVDLRANSITGTTIGSTDPIFLPDGFGGHVNFLFSAPISVIPGMTYFFQPIVQSGDAWSIDNYTYNYASGTEFILGSSSPFFDLWFREGIVVPESSTWGLFLLGCGALAWRRRLFQ